MGKETNKTEIISVRLDPLTKECLAYICAKEYRPTALQIRKIVEEFVSNYERDNNLLPNANSKGDNNYPKHPSFEM